MAKKRSDTNATPIAPTLEPSRGLEIVRKQLAKGDLLLSQHMVPEEEYRGWRLTASEILTRCFGSESKNTKNFGYVGMYGSFMLDGGPAYENELRRENLTKQLTILRSCIEQLEMDIETTETSVAQTPAPQSTKDRAKVFIVYGRNVQAYNQMAIFVRSLHLKPWDFNVLAASSGGSAFIGDIVRKGMDTSQTVIVLFTPDEHAALREDYAAGASKAEKGRWQARPNVIFEAGMALGIDEQRTILVTLGSDVELFSDVHGRHIVRLDNTTTQRQLLRQKLIDTGCDVDQTSME